MLLDTLLIEPLHLAYVLGVASIATELIAALNRSKLIRTMLYGVVFVAIVLAVPLLLANHLHLTTVIVAVVAFYRLVNAARVIVHRVAEPRLYFSSRRSSLVLLVAQVVSVVVWQLQYDYGLSPYAVTMALLVSAVAGAVLLAMSTRRNLSRMKIRPSDSRKSDTELPTVSVCIPARNETLDLPSCLSALLKSDYPKLEIIVLDDCSQDKTSEIIKGFAQQGVRFISGEPPKDGWLAKNQAYQALAEAASGEILLFCGVDTRFDKSAIRSMVASLSARKKQMISLLPKGLQSHEHASLVQPMRYWWEIALPRRLFNRPPVLSTVWMITRQAFFGRGEMKAVKASVLPEGYFARELTLADEYSFMRASGKMMVKSAKRLEDQWQTAIRVRYPRLRKRPENIMLVSLAALWLFVLPFGVFVAGFFTSLGLIHVLAGVVVLINSYTHYRLLRAWLEKPQAVALALFPAAVLADFVVMQISMFRYEFSTVTWKDRNICIPVMRYHKSLPKIEATEA